MREKQLLPAILFALFLALFSPTYVSAQAEYTSGVMAMRDCAGIDILNGCWDESHPFDPRVSCSTDNSKCVMLVYENRTDRQSIRIKYSTGVYGKHFENLAYGCPETGFGAWYDAVFGGCSEIGHLFTDAVTNYNESVYGLHDNFHLTYDVQYINGIFYALVNHDGSTSSNYPYLYILNSTGVYLQPSPICYYYAGGESEYSLGFCDAAGKYLMVRATSSYRTLFHSVKTSIFDCEHFDVYAEEYRSSLGLTPASMDVSICDIFVNNNRTGLVSIPKLVVDGRNVYNDTYGLDSFPTNYTGLDYYMGSDVIYQRDHNATWITHTSDWITFLNTSVYYPWPAGVTINISDSALDNTNQLYSFEKHSNVTGASGIYAYNSPVYSFSIRARGLNLNTLTVESVSVDSAISCNGGAWFYSASGVDQTLVTPCLTNNSIFITVSGWQPSSLVLNEINVLNPTGLTVITTPSNGLGWVNSYNVKFGAFDKFASVPIASATMSVDSVTKSTDSYGIAEYTLSPYQTANFYLSNSSNTYYLTLFGTPAMYDVYAYKTGFVTSTLTSVNLTGDDVPSSSSSFLRTYNIQLEPTNARLVVDVWWSDGLHYDGDTAIVRVSGSNGKIYLESGSILTEQNYATSFPATFVMQDNRSSWTASYNITSGAHFESTTTPITNTVNYYFHDFYLPNSSILHECTSNAGCTESFCKSNVWYSSGACSSGTCSYTQTSCSLFCDDRAGCYSSTTNTSCPTGLDMECYGLNNCADTKYLNSYICSSSKYCILDVTECSYMCDTAEDVCLVAPAASECDQSTPVGMLQCLQSGAYSLIKQTYNPLFIILIVIALVIIVVTLLALFTKGLTGAMQMRI